MTVTTLTVYTTQNSGLLDNRIWSLAVDQQGVVWIGTWGGLAVYRPDEVCTGVGEELGVERSRTFRFSRMRPILSI